MTTSFDKKSITLEAVRNLVTAAAQKARKMDVPKAIALVDPDGVLKAWSAVSFNMPTHGLGDFIKNDPPLLASFPHQEGMVLFGGRYPITAEGQLISGIGVNGGHYSQDHESAEAALAIVGGL